MITARITVHTSHRKNKLSDVHDMTEAQFNFLADVIHGLNRDHTDEDDPFISLNVLLPEDSE